MHAGRKILNLRCDRKISQQDLARACDITPSALSKIEAGINSPRANIIWRIAQNLGVTVEYLLDEAMPYPYSPHRYRQELLEEGTDPHSTERTDVTAEQARFLETLEECDPAVQEVVYELPQASLEMVRLVHFVLHRSRLQNPGPAFWKSLRELVERNGRENRGRQTRRAPSTRRRTSTKRPRKKPTAKASSKRKRTKKAATS